MSKYSSLKIDFIIQFSFFFFFNDTATTEIYTLSLHDALPISDYHNMTYNVRLPSVLGGEIYFPISAVIRGPELSKRSEEHTSELQSRLHLVCRLLLEKKKKQQNTIRVLYVYQTMSTIYQTTHY